MKSIKKIKSYLKKVKKRVFKSTLFSPYKGLRKYDLIIYDDIFPHPMSGFRLEEFTQLLNEFPNSKVMLEPTAYFHMNSPKKQHAEDVSTFLALHSNLKGKLQFQKRRYNINSKLFYCVFLNNLFHNLSWLEKYTIPFAFTLYPGGGFLINDVVTNQKLKTIFSSPMFRAVIVTQQFTKDYLISNNLCSADKIAFIFGCVVPQISVSENLPYKTNYNFNKDTLDICFCAAKYSARGEDKGYDIFIGTAHRLAELYEFVRFHVIGGFTEDDIDVTKLGAKITFYGYQKFDKLSKIYNTMDLLISANRPFVLNKGAFDGFPLGTVVEAAFNGVAVLVSDTLNQNVAFKNDSDLIIIENNIESVILAIKNLIIHPEKIKLIGLQGRQTFLNVYSNKVQLNPRVALLHKIIKNG